MTLTPQRLAPTPGATPRFNETTIAIVGAFLIAVVLSTVFIANPFHAMILAYTDYSHTPAAPGVPTASTTQAPGNQK